MTATTKLWEVAAALIELGPGGEVTNAAEVERTLVVTRAATTFRARAAVAKAARRQRWEKRQPVPEAERWITPTEAAREFGGSASNIRRAAALGYIAEARQSDSGRWLFTAAACRAWLADPSAHRTAHKK